MFVLQYLLLRAVTWRYVCNPFAGTEPLACFYAGVLLDKILILLSISIISPGVLVSYYKNKHMRNTAICNLYEKAKKFMNHFEKVTEMKINTHYSISGAKIIDLLDCMVEADSRVERYKYVNKFEEGYHCVVANYR